MWLGIDDTDSSQGMCTTYLAGDLIAAINKLGLDVIGMPRLVRLNPNIPWKTRGNGAIAIHFGHGAGERTVIGDIEGTRHSFPRRIDDGDLDTVLQAADAALRQQAMFDDEDTNPGLVVVPEQLPRSLYQQAVHSIVEQETARQLIDTANGQYIGYKNGRGIIGAAAAIAWQSSDVTYEIITYRNGDERWVDPASVHAMSRRFPSTFDSYDRENEHVQITPHSPCPVLYGIRGDNAEVLPEAMRSITSNDVTRWLLFETNQATDDHLQQRHISQVQPYESVMVTGTVAGMPYTIKGGHVIFPLAGNSCIDCAAYEPTKQFRDIVRQLRPGDRVTVCGGVRAAPLTVNMEKIRVEQLVPCYEKRENPVCPECRKHMKSHGYRQGYRCAICGGRAAENDALFERVERGLQSGWYEVPVVARRHLAKPLHRIKPGTTRP